MCPQITSFQDIVKETSSTIQHTFYTQYITSCWKLNFLGFIKASVWLGESGGNVSAAFFGWDRRRNLSVQKAIPHLHDLCYHTTNGSLHHCWLISSTNTAWSIEDYWGSSETSISLDLKVERLRRESTGSRNRSNDENRFSHTHANTCSPLYEGLSSPPKHATEIINTFDTCSKYTHWGHMVCNLLL